MFSVANLSHVIGQKRLLESVSATFGPGMITALVGHNGSGKSTLLKHLARQLKPSSGQVTYDGQPVDAIASRQFARQVAYLAQDHADTGLMTVEEFVACGRYPWHGALGRVTDEDRRAIEAAFETTQVEPLRKRIVSTLSGGERQRVRLAMLVAQNTRFLLLDEPTSELDVAHQVEVLSLIRRLSTERGCGVVIVLHDINMAAQFSDRIVALKGGRLIADDKPETFMNAATLSDVYGIAMDLLPRPGRSLPIAHVDVPASLAS